MKTNVFIIAASLYIILFLITLNITSLLSLSLILFALFPFMLVGMVYIVLKEKGFSYRELGEKDEWDYLDKKKNDMGFFG